MSGTYVSIDSDVLDFGFHSDQEEEFKRPPSGFEIEYACSHDWSGLAERTRTRAGNQKTGRSKMGRKRWADSRDEGSSDAASSSKDGSNDGESNSDSGRTSSSGSERDSSSESGRCGTR
jgi:hypothetical protein